MTSRNNPDEEFARLWKAFFDELKDMADEDIMEGVDTPKFRTDRIQFMASIRAEAGRRRLASAKAKLDIPQLATNRNEPTFTVSVAEAREQLRKASNDARFTMAARALEDMSDEMVLRTYARLQQLLSRDEESGN